MESRRLPGGDDDLKKDRMFRECFPEKTSSLCLSTLVKFVNPCQISQIRFDF